MTLRTLQGLGGGCEGAVRPFYCMSQRSLMLHAAAESSMMDGSQRSRGKAGMMRASIQPGWLPAVQSFINKKMLATVDILGMPDPFLLLTVQCSIVWGKRLGEGHNEQTGV